MKRSTKRFTPPKVSRMVRVCPHCTAPARVRTSEAMSPLSRTAKLQCTNVDCGFAWVEGSEILYAINTSGSPNPDINIPTRRKEAKQ